ncbi:hypothetical protein BGZ92_005805, partial [Podila epicladia]
MGRQRNLRHLVLNTRLVFDFPATLLEAFLDLKHLQLLDVYVTVEDEPSSPATLPTALKMVLDLMNQHPRLDIILFDEWRTGESHDDNRRYQGRRMYYSDGGEDEYEEEWEEAEEDDEIAVEEMKAFKELKDLFAEGVLPNLRSLELPEADMAIDQTLRIYIQSTCPNIRRLTLQPKPEPEKC